MSDTTDGYTPVETIYAGRRQGQNDKPVIVFYVIGTDETAVFGSPAIRSFRTGVIGGIYTHQRKGDSFRLSTQWVRDSKDVRIVGWRAADDAFDTAERARKRIAAERTKGKQSILTALVPFRAEYQKTDHVGRLALEVVLLHALRS